jgi:curved DNA-binding protein CbpA
VSITDPYKILQVDSEAEPEVIEAAYRRLARKYHPDVASGPDAQARMVQINGAWELLRDPVSRAAVDRARIRSAGSAARAASADARARAAEDTVEREPRTSARSDAAKPRSGPESPPPASERPGSSAKPVPPWPFDGMRDPSDGEADTPTHDTVSRDWTSGRSTTGSTYDPSTMRYAQGEGAAGPPPGNPTGSVLNFGRYAGWSLGEIARRDIEYLEWLDRVPIGRMYQQELDGLLRTAGRRRSAPPEKTGKRGLFRRR